MSEKEQTKTRRLAAMIDAEDFSNLRIEAAKRDVPMADLVRRAVSEWLSRNKDDETLRAHKP